MRVPIGENCGSLRMSTGCCCCESLRCTCHWYCPCPKTALSSILPSLSVGNLWRQMQAMVLQKQQYGFDTDDHQQTWHMNLQLVMERFNFSSKCASKVVVCCLISSPALSTHALLPGSATLEFSMRISKTNFCRTTSTNDWSFNKTGSGSHLRASFGCVSYELQNCDHFSRMYITPVLYGG